MTLQTRRASQERASVYTNTIPIAGVEQRER